LPVVYVPANISVHFVSPEPIRYADISVKSLAGDLPVPNILRVRQRDSAKFSGDAVVTITGEKYLAQYRLVPCPSGWQGAVQTEVAVGPSAMTAIDNPDAGLSQPELKAASLRLLASKPGKAIQKVEVFGLTGKVNPVYTLGDYIFLDVSYDNRTRLSYTIDQLRFSIEDKKVTRAGTVQSVDVKPIYVLQNVSGFERHYRNIFVFKKLTFPGNKVFCIELSEKQLSGRCITLKADYKDLLHADTLP
jgi:conjugative transposon TraN protein